MTARRNVAKRVRATPLPQPQPVNREGLEVSSELTRKIRRGIAQINRGNFRTFDTAKQAADYIFHDKT